jgi:stage II sporulation protein D
MTVKANDVFPYLSPTPLNNNTPCGYCSASPHYRWSATFPLGEIVRKFGLEKTCSRPEVGITEVDSTRRAREISLLDRKGTVLRRLHADDFRRIINKGRPLKRRMRSTRIDSISLSGNAVTIEGGGYGHGVGLCQYGARGLAKEGRDYRQILDYYYRDCEIKTLAELGESGPVKQ